MKIRNTAAVVATIATVATIQSAQAAFQDNLADLIATHGTLTIGDKTFSGFSALDTGLTSYDASQIMVTASQIGNVDFLTWTGNISFVSGGVGTADLLLGYTVTANPGSINLIDQQYTGSANGGFLAIDETVNDINGNLVASSSLTATDKADEPGIVNPNPLVVGPGPETFQGDNLVVNPAQNVLVVTKDIGFAVSSPLGGLDTISAVSQSFHQVAVPEPTTVIAGALLLLPFGVSTLRIMRKNRIS